MDKRETEIVRATIDILKKHLDLSKVILFGSRAKGNKNKHADFDFAVDSEQPPLSVQREINEEIEKISGLYKVDIVYIPSVDEEFKNIIKETGKLIYEKRT